MCQHSDEYNRCIVFDLDGTLIEQMEPKDYGKTIPMLKNIKICNALYDQGHHITIFTARHDLRREFTRQQLKKLGIRYHDLICNKPLWDVYIGDKAENIRSLRDAKNLNLLDS